MTSKSTDSVHDSESQAEEKPSNTGKRLSLCYWTPVASKTSDADSVITTRKERPKKTHKDDHLANDGLYTSLNTPLTRTVVKPYPLEYQNPFCKSEQRLSGRLLEIAIRDVQVRPNEGTNKSLPEVTSVTVLFKDKVICKANKPFNRKLHKLLIRNSSDSNSLSIRVNAQGKSNSTLPLPLPKRSVREKRLEIDFALKDTTNVIYSGTVICTISLLIRDPSPPSEKTYSHVSSPNDPNDPRNSASLNRPKSHDDVNKQVSYFLLHDPALCFPTSQIASSQRHERRKTSKSADIVVAEQTFSLIDLFRNLFQVRCPQQPTSASSSMKHHSGRKHILMVNVLRGVEVPVREESALVQPLIEIEWGDVVKCTEVSDGPAPVWQQTIEFEVPRMSGEQCIKLRWVQFAV